MPFHTSCLSPLCRLLVLPSTLQKFSPLPNLPGPLGLKRWAFSCLAFQCCVGHNLGRVSLELCGEGDCRAVGVTGTWDSPCAATKHYVTLQVPKPLHFPICWVG